MVTFLSIVKGLPVKVWVCVGPPLLKNLVLDRKLDLMAVGTVHPAGSTDINNQAVIAYYEKHKSSEKGNLTYRKHPYMTS